MKEKSLDRSADTKKAGAEMAQCGVRYDYDKNLDERDLGPTELRRRRHYALNFSLNLGLAYQCCGRPAMAPNHAKIELDHGRVPKMYLD